MGFFKFFIQRAQSQGLFAIGDVLHFEALLSQAGII
jgi:hypothetical protein